MKRFMMPFFIAVCLAACRQDERQGRGPVAPAQQAAKPQRERGELGKVGNEFVPTSASFSPDGTRLVVGFNRRQGAYTGPRWKMWDLATTKECPATSRNFDPYKEYPNVSFISFLPDGKRILTVEPEPSTGVSTCRIWDERMTRPLREFNLGATGRGSLSADRRFLLTWGQKGAYLWNVETGKREQEIQVEGFAYPTRLSPDGAWAIGKDENGATAYYDLKNHAVIRYVKPYHAMTEMEKEQEYSHPFRFSPDGKTVLAIKRRGLEDTGVAFCDAATLKVRSEIADFWSPEDLKVRSEVPGVLRVKEAAFTADSEKLVILDCITQSTTASFSQKCRFRCWDVKSNRKLWTKVYTESNEPRYVKLLVLRPA